MSHWLMFYSPSHPEIITPWSNTAQPNIYNAHLTIQQLKQHGALLLGQIGETCDQTDFSIILQPFLSLKIDELRDITFAPQPVAEPKPLCVALIAPKRN